MKPHLTVYIIFWCQNPQKPQMTRAALVAQGGPIQCSTVGFNVMAEQCTLTSVAGLIFCRVSKWTLLEIVPGIGQGLLKTQ